MANSVVTNFRINGSRRFTAIVEITGDGSPDLSKAVILDPANMTGAPATFKIHKVNWDLDGFSAALYWDAATPTLALGCPTYGDEMDFFEMGAPLVNDAVSPTGKLTMDTTGLTATGRGTITITGVHS